LHNWHPKDIKKEPEGEHVLDKWILTRLHQVTRDFTVNIEKYYVPQAIQPLEDFVDDLSRWYVRRSRDRISDNEGNVMEVFYHVLVTFSKVCAPVTPFLAEEIYQQLKLPHDFEESVHLETYPQYDEGIISQHEELLMFMQQARDMVSAALSIRVNNKIPVRQPLESLITTEKYKLPEEYLTIIKDETNIKDIIFKNDLEDLPENSKDQQQMVALNINISAELKKEGLLRDIIRRFQDERKKNKLRVNDRIIATYPDQKDIKEVVHSFESELKEKILADKLISGKDYAVELSE